MPGSAIEGKDLVHKFIVDNNLKKFLDIGAGEGTYFNVLNGQSFYTDLAPVSYSKLDGVEIWGPYIPQYQLYNKYDTIIIADARWLGWNALPEARYDMVFLGDVIEHMTFEDGQVVIDRAAGIADYLVVTLPIYGYAQHVGYEGNWYETHVVQYSDESIKRVLAPYEMLVEFQGGTVGTYIVRT